MSVYKNDKPEFLIQALDSIIYQTIMPKEIIIVVDGPVSNEINCILEKYAVENQMIRLHRFLENRGLGTALREGLKECTCDIVARMDSDDISVQNRFELEAECFMRNKELGMVGSNISEFIETPTNIVGKRCVPEVHDDIVKYMKRRCPFNHMTVMFKKSEVLAAGNYMDWFSNEDYYLWIRMFEQGCKFENLNCDLVNVRVGKEMYRRRGGWKYFVSEKNIQKYMFDKRMISYVRYLSNVFARFVLQVIMPNRVRGWIYKKIARN